MKIGIAGPVSIKSLRPYLSELEDWHLTLGLGGTAVNNLIGGLISCGCQVSVYTLDISVKEPIILKGPSLTVYIGHYRPRGHRRMSDFFYKESTQIKQFILEDKPDIVNAHWTYEFAIGAIRATDKHLLTFRDDAWEILKINSDLYRSVRFIMDRWVRWKGKHFNVNSPYLQKSLGIAPDLLPIIPNPISESLVQTSGKKYPAGGKFRIVSLINGWNDRKNPETALRAFHLLITKHHPNAELHLFGNGCDAKDPSFQWAKKHSLDQKVFFHGEKKYVDLMRELPEYDILLHSAVEESFGNTLIEAMATGLPVVAGKDAGAVPWVLNYGKNGVLVDVKSESAILEGLLNLIHNPALYNQLSESGLEWVRKNFSAIPIARQYIKLYQQIAKSTATSELIHH